jgi:hypothetical protein
MARIELRAFIRAPAARIWSIITDLGGQTRWMEDISRLEIVSDVKSGVGTVMDATTALFGRPMLHDVMEIVASDEPVKLEIVHKGQFSGRGLWLLEPAPGGTSFYWLEEFAPPLGPLGELAAKLVVGPHLRRVWGRSMENVRLLAESPTPA